MDSIGLEFGSGEARHEQDPGLVGADDVRKLLQDLREVVAVPDGGLAVHGRTHKALEVRPGGSEGLELRQQVKKDRLHALGDVGGSVAAGEEVRHAGQHSDGRLGPDQLDGLRQYLQTTALQDLSASHQWTVTTVHGSHVPLDVRITDDREQHCGR